VTVAGAGSTWNNSDALTVGGAGIGNLAISDGGTVTSIRSYLGTEAEGQGTATVVGSGSTWSMDGYLMVGHAGRGSLRIENGGTVNNGQSASIGTFATATGSVTVTGESSNWNNNGPLTVAGMLSVEDGGTVTNAWSNVGNGQAGQVTVAGEGSHWSNLGSLSVGAWDRGTLDITDGGQVSVSEWMVVGYDRDTTGLASGHTTVAGDGSKLTVASQLTVGRNGEGALVVEEGGAVQSNQGSVGAFAGSTGTATISGRDSHWSVDRDLHVGGRSDSPEGGTGDLRLTDDGSLTVGEHLVVYPTGTVDVIGGRALVGTGDLPTETGTLLVSSGGRLSGTGTILGDVVISGGLLDPGFSPGTLFFEGDLQLLSGSELLIQVAGSPESSLFDTINVNGDAFLGGLVTFDFGDYRPANGATYSFIDTTGSMSLAFESVQVRGLSMDSLNYDPSTGQFSVVPEPGSFVLLATGIVLFGLIRRRRSRKPVD